MAEFVENTTVSDLVEVLEEEQVLDRLNCAILWVQITHAHERVGSVYVCVAGRRARGGPEERGCCVWGLLALHQSAAMSTNLDPSGRSINLKLIAGLNPLCRCADSFGCIAGSRVFTSSLENPGSPTGSQRC